MPCKVFRVGIFFDGTGNNKSYDKEKGEGGQSNIAKLSDLYKKGTSIVDSKDSVCDGGKELTSDMIYVNGVGTYDSIEEHNKHPIQRKYDKGGGGGGAKRINEAIFDLAALLDAHPYDKTDPAKFTKREIDVFGFSRGAAMARDFVNTMVFKKINLNKKYKDVRFNFIGIYETVGSFGEAGNNIDMKPINPDEFSEADKVVGVFSNDSYGMVDAGTRMRKKTSYLSTQIQAEQFIRKMQDEGWTSTWRITIIMDTNIYEVNSEKSEKDLFEDYNFNLASKSAKTIVHMTAHHEVRKNFPLTNIASSGNIEWRLLGVHSDIGGGYPENTVEKHAFSLYFNDTQGRAKAIAEGWTVTPYYFYGAVSSYICTKNRQVNNDLPVVTLHLMHKEALKNNVPLKDLTEQIPQSMQKYYKYAVQMRENAYLYTDKPDGSHIVNKYVHHSGVDPIDIHTKYEGSHGFNDIYYNDSADGGGNDINYVEPHGKTIDPRKNRRYPRKNLHVQREIYNNKPSKAIIPS